MADDDAGRRQVVALPRLDRTEFDYYLGWTHRPGMVDHRPVFECELHAAIIVALGLHEIPTDLNHTQATWIGDVHRRLSLLLLETKTARDPATRWDDFLERLWSDCQRQALDLPIRAVEIVATVEHDPPIIDDHQEDDHQEPGIPLRLLPWLDRMQFQRSITDTYRQQRPDHARERFDPAGQWEEFREIIWAGREPGTETR